MPASPGSTAAALEQQLPRLVERWEERVRREMTGAAARDQPALRDHLPEFLRQLVAALSDPSRTCKSFWRCTSSSRSRTARARTRARSRTTVLWCTPNSRRCATR
jgi:hypothetical protein